MKTQEEINDYIKRTCISREAWILSAKIANREWVLHLISDNKTGKELKELAEYTSPN